MRSSSDIYKKLYSENHPMGFHNGNAGPNDEYAYDDYGNLIADPYKGIEEITYNHQNLPVAIMFVGGEKIEYTYLADGTKLKKTVTDATNTITTTEYIGTSTPLSTGAFQYTNETLEFFPHAEGYIRAVPNDIGGGPTNYSFFYVFTYTDHTSTPLSTGLGNIRLKYTKHPRTGELEILEDNHYYPYACPERSRRGMTHIGYNPQHKTIFEDGSGITIIPVSPHVNDPYKYKFGGKEYQEEFDVNFYDFGARNYDAALGRWMNVDPLAEDYYSQSSYQYTLNNPIVYIDPDGMKVDMTHLMKTGNEGLQTAIGMLFDLIEQTGLSLSIQKNKDGRFMLEYDTDSTNEWMYEIDGVRAGSEDARSQLKKMIDDPNVALVGLSPDNRGSGVPQGSNIIYMDPVQIESHIENVSEGLNSKTMGYGMTFLHETYHTTMGGGLRDTENEYEQGPVVKKMNAIRSQLDDNLWNRTRGKNTQYGERKYYMANDERSSRSNGVKIIKATMHFTIMNNKGKKVKANTQTQKQE